MEKWRTESSRRPSGSSTSTSCSVNSGIRRARQFWAFSALTPAAVGRVRSSIQYTAGGPRPSYVNPSMSNVRELSAYTTPATPWFAKSDSFPSLTLTFRGGRAARVHRGSACGTSAMRSGSIATPP
ncbi:unnamed protein product [Chondrus crispus]|uniref:Uncharacterized protein n=1 Tax=Chondrus crispus TaxID=2769 RepID=R7QA94_CHOCR|nr:unnamed protein product [Chondrus crispus]CDF34703.1 unnamed protein product [Chondrus crispus]|eukprot:XP_005714522.1 unnamed protein product [Chondrus crispus]